MHIVTLVVFLLIVGVIIGGAMLIRSGLRTGAGRGATDAMHQCPECGEMNPARAHFCGHCGARAP